MDAPSEARRKMVEQQLKSRGIRSPQVLEVMARVPREHFVPRESAASAFADQALPIDCDQTISQPYMVALMTESLELTGGERVLEIGTGSGYQTAILAELAAEVYTVERHKLLLLSAQTRLNELEYRNIYFRHADGREGWADESPFDRIIITAAAESCPTGLMLQLADDGLLIGPFGTSEVQTLQVMRKVNGQQQQTELTRCRFVPLV